MNAENSAPDPRSGPAEGTPRRPDGAEPDPLERGPLCFLVGPTAAGKSALALAVAERAGAEILSLDSMSVYRGLDVGTAKPTAAERARVPHHLIDLVEPHETYSVQRYVDDARRALGAIAARGRRALFVGGTGLYLKALVHGLFEGPPIDPAVRAGWNERAEREGSPVLWQELARADPESADRIHPNDRKRVVRALETLEQTGRPLSDWQREWGADRPGRPRRIVGLSVAPAALDAAIRARVERMLAAGWPDEVRRLGRLGPTAGQALGYAEVRALVDGRIDRATCVERIALRTRQFARRQRTWFRSFPEIRWIEAAGHAKRAEESLDAFGWSGAADRR